jgi:hypothetical protein
MIYSYTALKNVLILAVIVLSKPVPLLRLSSALMLTQKQWLIHYLNTQKSMSIKNFFPSSNLFFENL